MTFTFNLKRMQKQSLSKISSDFKIRENTGGKPDIYKEPQFISSLVIEAE